MAGLRTRQAEVLKVQGASAVSGAARQLLFMETMKNPHKKSSMSWRGADYTKGVAAPQQHDLWEAGPGSLAQLMGIDWGYLSDTSFTALGRPNDALPAAAQPPHAHRRRRPWGSR
eukprot:433286-Prymnesium_polylepis.1